MKWTQVILLLAAVTVAAAAGRLLQPVQEERPPLPSCSELNSRVSRLESRVEELEAALRKAPADGQPPASPAADVGGTSVEGAPLPPTLEGIENVVERYPPPVATRIKEVVARFSLEEDADLEAAAEYVEEIECNHDLRLDNSHLDLFWPVFLNWRRAYAPLKRRYDEAEEASLAWRCTEAERPGLQSRVREIGEEMSAVFLLYRADAQRFLPAEVYRKLFE